jgi:hypothetical protein
MSALPCITNSRDGTTLFALKGQGGGGIGAISSLTVSSLLVESSEIGLGNGAYISTIGGQLIYFDGTTLEPISQLSSLSTIEDWSFYPAISTVNMGNENLLGANVIAADSISTNTASVSSIQGNTAQFSSIVANDISTFSLTAISTIHAISSISSSTADIEAINTSSINGVPISTIIGGEMPDSVFSTLVAAISVSTPSLFVSSINGAEFTSTSVNVQQVTTSSIITDSISTLSAEIRQGLVSSLQFNPSLGGVSLGGVNLGLGSILGNVIGWGAGVFGAAAGTVGMITGTAALMNGRPGNNINTNNYEMINGTTQLQFSTLGASTTSIFRSVSSIGDPSQVPGEEVFISTNLLAGTHAVRSVSDPLNTMSSPTSSIQAFGQWVEVPFAMPSSLSSINNWAEFPAVSTIDAASNNLAGVAIGYISSLNADTISTAQIASSSISTAYLLGANSNLFGMGAQGLEIDAANLFLSTPNVIHPGNYNGSTCSFFEGRIRDVIASTVTTSSINANQLAISTISTNSILGSATDMFGIPGYDGGLNIIASTLALTSTPLIVHTGNYNGSTASFFQANIRDVIASTMITSTFQTNYAVFNQITTFNTFLGLEVDTNSLSTMILDCRQEATFKSTIFASSINAGQGILSSLAFRQKGAIGLSSLIGLSTAIVPGSGSSTITTLNTDLSLGNNLLWARQARLGFGNGNENVSEVLMYGGGGDFRVLKSGQGDTTVRVGTNISGTNTGYLFDTLLNKPFFSTINQSTSLMAYFPSSLTSTIGISTISFIPPKVVAGAFISLSTQVVLAADTPLPIVYDTTSYAVGGITFSTSAIVIPAPGIFELSMSIQLDKTGGGVSPCDFWFRKNGTNIPNSASQTTVQGTAGEILATVSIFEPCVAGDKIEVLIASSDATMSAKFFQSTITPYVRPAIPSIIMNAKCLNY